MHSARVLTRVRCETAVGGVGIWGEMRVCRGVGGEAGGAVVGVGGGAGGAGGEGAVVGCGADAEASAWCDVRGGRGADASAEADDFVAGGLSGFCSYFFFFLRSCVYGGRMGVKLLTLRRRDIW